MVESTQSGIDFEAYADKLDTPIAALVMDVRRFILDLVPDASERLKWRAPWYERNGPFCYIGAHSKHINLGFPRGAELVDSFDFLQGTGKGMRHVKIFRPEELEDPALAEVVRAAVALNEA